MDETIEAFVADPKNCTREEFAHVFQDADPLSMDVLVTGEGPDPDDHDEEWHGFFATDTRAGYVTPFIPVSEDFRKRFWMDEGAVAGVTTDPEGGVTPHFPLHEVEYRGRTCAELTYTPLRFRLSYDLLVPVTEDLVVGRLHAGRYPYGFGLVLFGMLRH